MNKDAIIKLVNEQMWPKTDADVPSFKAGDTITVTYRIVEGVGVERIFPLYSPHIDKIEVNKVGIVRRARIYYLRQLTGKKARIKEKRITK